MTTVFLQKETACDVRQVASAFAFSESYPATLAIEIPFVHKELTRTTALSAYELADPVVCIHLKVARLATTGARDDRRAG